MHGCHAYTPLNINDLMQYIAQLILIALFTLPFFCSGELIYRPKQHFITARIRRMREGNVFHRCLSVNRTWGGGGGYPPGLWSFPGGGILSWLYGYPPDRIGVPLPLNRSFLWGGVPLDRIGIPLPLGRIGATPSPRTGERVFELSGGRYASYGHAGGLSLLMQNKILS